MYYGVHNDPYYHAKRKLCRKMVMIEKRGFPSIQTKILIESLKSVNVSKKVHALQPS